MATTTRNLLAIAAVLTLGLLPPSAFAQTGRNPELVELFQQGVAALQEEKYEEAIALLDQVLAGDDTFGEAALAKGDAYRGLEEYENAIRSYQSAEQTFAAYEGVEKNKALAAIYNGRGISYRELGDPNLLGLALNDFRNAAELDSNNPEVEANLGEILVNNAQDLTQAMQYLDRAIEGNPEDAEAYRNRGWAHSLLREFEDGIADLKKAIELDPDDYETYQRLANVHLAQDEAQEGIDALSKAIEFYEPKDSGEPETYIGGYLQRAQAALGLAKKEDTPEEKRTQLYDSVIADTNAILDEFPDRFPQSGLAMYYRGAAQRMKGLFAEAITSLTDAIQLIPAGQDSNYVSEAYLLRGICWFYQGQINLARGDFREASSQSLVDPRPSLWMGYCHAKEEDFRKAIESYGNAAAKQPNFSLAYINRGLAYMQLKDYDKAVENFNEAIRAEPTEPKHFYKKGLAHEMNDELQKALDSFQLALLRKGDYADANRAASRVLQKMGRPGLGQQYQNRVNAPTNAAP